MTGGELAIVIAGRRDDWPGGARTLTPREPTREPNGTLWFGAELDPDGDQVWFRIAEEAINRMPEKTPAARGRRLVDALIVWITPDRPLEPGINRFEVRVSEVRRHMDRTPPVVKMDPPAPTHPVVATAGERVAPAAHRLAAASLSSNTRRAYSGALRRLDAWLAGRALEDATLAGYLAELHEQGRAPSSASTAVAAARFRARLAGEASPAGERTARVLAGYRRTAVKRGRGQARPFGAADLAAVLATCQRRRRRGRGVESEEVALERGRLDAVIAGLLFMAGMRRGAR